MLQKYTVPTDAASELATAQLHCVCIASTLSALVVQFVQIDLFKFTEANIRL